MDHGSPTDETISRLVDPELRALLAGYEPTGDATPDVGRSRSMMTALAMQRGTAAPGTAENAYHVPGPPGAPAVRVLGYFPDAPAGWLPAMLHIHGGGYIMGFPEMQDSENRLRAAAMNCAIFSVDYRLAPETPFPGAVEDCYAVLKWLHENAAQLGIDAKRIGVKGESAGGGLAAALAILARDRGGPKLTFQHLIYPMLDDRTCVTPDPHPHTGMFVWTPALNNLGWSSLLGTAPGGADVSPYAAAARETDLRGLPPAFIAVGGLDLFLEEDIEYARRLGRAGVPVELHVYPGAFHGFGRAVEARVSQAFERDSAAALRRGLEMSAGGPTDQVAVLKHCAR